MGAWISCWKKQGKKMPVSYTGRDPLPDTFKDGAQALVEGQLMPDGQFHGGAGAGQMRVEVSSQPTGASPACR